MWSVFPFWFSSIRGYYSYFGKIGYPKCLFLQAGGYFPMVSDLLASAVFAWFLSLPGDFSDFSFLVIRRKHPSAIGLLVIASIGGIGKNFSGILGGYLLVFNLHFYPPRYLPYCSCNRAN
jgi:hypothetical protein